MSLTPSSQTQSAFNTIIRPQQAPNYGPSTSAQTTDQVSISSAAKALASEANESSNTEAIEPLSTQISEGESASKKTINIIA